MAPTSSSHGRPANDHSNVEGPANAELAPVNDRMPLVLMSEAQYARWRGPEIKTRELLRMAMQAVVDFYCRGRDRRSVTISTARRML